MRVELLNTGVTLKSPDLSGVASGAVLALAVVVKRWAGVVGALARRWCRPGYGVPFPMILERKINN